LDDLRGVDPGSSTLANVRCMRSPRLQADKAHDGPQSQLVALGGPVMSSGSSVCKATLADVPRLAQALASAFQDDPVITWVLPDEQRRRVVLVAFMEFRPRNLAFPHDEVWMIQDGAAAAAWVPPPGRWPWPSA
jgi:hypothetical protein